MTTITINVYRDGSAWFGARWIGDEYDGCDELPVDEDATEAEAMAAAKTMPLCISGQRVVVKVDDIDSAHGRL